MHATVKNGVLLSSTSTQYAVSTDGTDVRLRGIFSGGDLQDYG